MLKNRWASPACMNMCVRTDCETMTSRYFWMMNEQAAKQNDE